MVTRLFNKDLLSTLLCARHCPGPQRHSSDQNSTLLVWNARDSVWVTVCTQGAPLTPARSLGPSRCCTTAVEGTRGSGLELDVVMDRGG